MPRSLHVSAPAPSILKRTLSALALLALVAAPHAASAQRPPTIEAFGLTHLPLGQAAVTFDAQGRLTVSNIGSSGNDGVRVELGDAPRGLRMEFDAARPATSLEIGAVYRFVLDGDGGGEASLTMMHTGPELVVQPDFTSFGSGAYEIQITISDGNSLTFAGGALSVEATPTALAAEWEGTPCTSSAPLRYDLLWPAPVVVMVEQQVHLATRVTITSLDDFTAAVGAARTEVAMEELVIAHEGLVLDGNDHGGVASVKLRPLADRLVVEMLPADGSGGLRIEPAPGATSGSHRTATRWLPVPSEPGFDPPQAALHLRVYGQSDQTLLETSVVGEFRRVDMFEAPGASSLRVQVLDAGLLVADEVVPLGTVAELGDWPIAAVVHQETPTSHPVVQWKLLSAQPMKILRPNLIVAGTELRIQPVGGSPLPGAVRGSDLLIGGTTQFAVVPWSSSVMPSVPLLGLAHRALGQATVNYVPSGHIEVQNIGCSGDDGCEVETGPVDGFAFDLGGVQLPIEATLRLRAVESDCAVAGLEMASAMSGVMFRPDGKPLRATVQISLSDGELIGYVYDGDPVSSPTPPDRIGCAGRAPDELMFWAEWDAPQTVTVPGVGPVTTTRVEHVLLLSAPATPTTWRLLASDTPPFEVARETLDKFGQGFSVLGQAQMSIVDDRLVLGNIGASGDDGLDVHPVNPAPAFQGSIQVHVEELEPSLPIGSTVTFQGVGTASLPTYETVKIVYHTVMYSALTSGDIDMVADYSPLGAFGHRVSLWNHEQLVAESTGLGAVASFDRTPTSFAEELTPDGPVYFVGWDEPAEVTLTGANSKTGGIDKMKHFARTLRLEPLGPTLNLDALEALRIQATGPTSLALVEVVSVTAAGPDLAVAAGGVVLHPNAPNPFNPATRISYTLERAGRVNLRIFDLRGRLVRTLWQGNRPAGTWSARWDGTDAANRSVASGVYLLRLELDGAARERKITLLK